MYISVMIFINRRAQLSILSLHIYIIITVNYFLVIQVLRWRLQDLIYMLLHSNSWLDFTQDLHNISRPDIIKFIPKKDEKDTLVVTLQSDFNIQAHSNWQLDPLEDLYDVSRPDIK